ncbi:MAG: trypsin-like peptidase domain-containing protein [Planctomycetaceae bacterium]
MLRTSMTAVTLFAATCCVSGDAFADNRQTPLVRAVQQCRRSVVNIHTERLTADEKESRFFSAKPRKVTGMGTGIIVDERGYIVTNYHVIQDVDRILVTQEDGTSFDARPVSFDRRQDLAIIRIESREPLDVMPMGTSSDLMLAETVFAVGNAYGYEHTVTSGIVSALHRDVEVDETQSYENLIQTDASINPGNSGGPLLNLEGEVIGINVAIRAGAQRIGFAIPIDDARQTIARLMSVERLNGVAHGLTTRDVKSADALTLVVDSVAPGSDADLCGIRAGDVLQSVRGITINDGTDLERSLLDIPAGRTLDVLVQRGGEEYTLSYTIGAGRSVGNSYVSAKSGSGLEAKTVSTTGPSLPVLTEPEATAAEPTPDPVVARAWEMFGIRLEALDDKDMRSVQGRYKGGMKISNVRQGGPAARHGLRNGDILVGLDDYETLGPANLRYILSEDRIRTMNSISFLIVRAGSVPPLTGAIDLRGVQR